MALAVDPLTSPQSTEFHGPEGPGWSNADDAADDEFASARWAAGPQRVLFEFGLLNLAAVALLGAAHMQGWIGTVLAADATNLTLAIAAVFLVGLSICAMKLRAIIGELNCVRSFDPCRRSLATRYLKAVDGRSAGSRAITGSALKAKLGQRIAVVRHLANSLVLLGLIGTVLGFVIALSGVDPEQVGDVRNIAPMVSELISGMSVALYTTLVGSVLNLWLMMNYRILSNSAVRLAIELIALGESNART